MKKILLFACWQLCLLCVSSQTPTQLPADEMKQAIAELKKEISVLEEEFRKAEKEDPEWAATLKTQLNTYKSMLAAFDKTKPAAAKPKATAGGRKAPLPETPSPILRIQLKQPVLAPTTAQAKDRFFWYKGRKINDSTLITPRKTLVQYSRKRQLLIVQPDEKKDSFVSIAREITRSEQRKRELVEQFDKTPNGFIYYPYLVNSLAAYDDLSQRFSKAVQNSFSLPGSLPGRQLPANMKPGQTGKGGFGYEDGMEAMDVVSDSLPDLQQWVLQQLEEAQQKLNQLPAAGDFPAPPPHELGRCGSCDTSLLARQRQQDERWLQSYLGREKSIMEQVLSAMGTYEQNGKEKSEKVYEKFNQLINSFQERLQQKDQLLLERYGDKLPYLPVIAPVILGNERQRQLLGSGEESYIDLLLQKTKRAYEQYYREQKEARNHDFILNVPLHLGMYRQMALLGDAELSSAAPDYLEELKAYNRFALTMEMDFIWQQDADGKLERRATGSLETSRKIYVWLYPDGCSYRIMAHGTDLANKTLENITLPMKVKSGIKTIREDNDQLKDYPYQGPPEYAFRFPDSKIDFCDNGADTLFLAIMGGNEAVAARAQGDLQQSNKTYSIDMLIFASQVLINENTDDLIQGSQDAGQGMMNTISGFMQMEAPENTLGKIRMQYDGYMAMDNQRKMMENTYSSSTARIVFQANNRASVLTDTYLDTKRKLENDAEVKKGLFHLRMVHEPETSPDNRK